MRLARQGAEPFHLVLVDGHGLARGGLRSMLAGAHNLAVVGEASNGREALEVCGRLHPDLVLMDLQLGDMDGLAVTRAIRQAWPTTSVLLFTMHETPHYAVEAHRAGANGYVLKGATRRELLDAVYSALATPGKTDRGQRAPPTGTQNAKRGSGLQSGDCPVM